jgi:hypothetical protein
MRARLVASVLLLAAAVSFGAAGHLAARGRTVWEYGASQATAAAPACSKTWVGHEAEVEEYLKTAPIEKFENVPIGVTKPKRAYFKPGGPVASVAWKNLKPGLHGGYWDSYTSEIAAYELDKLLEMHMVAPAVERRVEGDLGAVVQWVENIRSWKVNEPPRAPDIGAWNRELIRMKMFDDLICNKDRNQGNLLYDGEYHLVLIDHSRAFIVSRDLPNKGRMNQIDRELWDRMMALTPERLQPVLGRWIGSREIRSLLERRDLMRNEIDKLVAARGEAAVFLR